MGKRKILLCFLLILISVLSLLSGCSQNELPKITDVNQIYDIPVGAIVGTTQENYATEHLPEANIHRYNGFPDAVVALQTGTVDAVLIESFKGQNAAQQDSALKLFPEPLMEEPYAMATRKGNEELINSLNEFITQAQQDGTIQKLYDKWILGKSPKVLEPVAYSPDAQTLVVGTDSTLGEPFDYLDANGNYIGYEIELLTLYAQQHNLRLEIKDMYFSGLIPAVQSGGVDLIACSITVTEERKKNVDFTQSYVASGTSVLIRNPEASTQGGFLETFKQKFYDNFIYQQRYLLILDGLWATILISLLSVLLGMILGALLCGAMLSRFKLLRGIAAVYSNIMRCTPVLVLLMIVTFVIFAGSKWSPIVIASIAFGLNEGAYMAEIFASSVRSVDKGQIEAARSMGFSSFGTFTTVTLPQAVKQALPVFKSEFISLVKMTSVVGYIAIQDLTKAGEIIRSRTFEAFLPLLVVAIIYIILINLLLLAFQYLEKKVSRKRGKKA